MQPVAKKRPQTLLVSVTLRTGRPIALRAFPPPRSGGRSPGAPRAASAARARQHRRLLDRLRSSASPTCCWKQGRLPATPLGCRRAARPLAGHARYAHQQLRHLGHGVWASSKDQSIDRSGTDVSICRSACKPPRPGQWHARRIFRWPLRSVNRTSLSASDSASARSRRREADNSEVHAEIGQEVHGF
jgi:hypothetical protein